jgi:hypothetical protein
MNSAAGSARSFITSCSPNLRQALVKSRLRRPTLPLCGRQQAAADAYGGVLEHGDTALEHRWVSVSPLLVLYSYVEIVTAGASVW